MKIIKFERPDPPKPEPNPALIAVLEEMLARARAGETRSLHAVEAVNEDYNLWDVGEYDLHQAMGRQLELLLILFMEQHGLIDEDE